MAAMVRWSFSVYLSAAEQPGISKRALVVLGLSFPILIIIMFCLAAVDTGISYSTRDQCYVRYLLVCVPLVLMLFAIALAPFRKSCASYVILLVTFALWSVLNVQTALEIINCKLDRSPPVIRRVLALSAGTYTRHRSWTESGFINVECWDDSSKQVQLPEAVNLVDYVTPGETIVELRLRKGFLGYEWLEDYRLIQPDGAIIDKEEEFQRAREAH